jgi:D-alanyl-D-alanine carboxypeptidase
MKNRLLLVFLITFLPILGFCQIFNKAKLDSLCNILNKNDKLLGGICIMQNDKEVFDYTFNKDYKFNGVTRIGSITKVYTAVLIMQLVEEGRLKLDDKLSSYFPKIDGSKKITIQHLLTHQSGIYSFDNDYVLGDIESWIYKPQSKEDMLKRFYSYKLQFEPGSKTAYSNTGYALLGYIIEDITNSSYNDQLQKRICMKLGLTQTFCSNIVDITKNESYSFLKDNGWVQYPSSNLSGAAAGGAGGICSTPKEVALFYNAIFNGTLLSKSSVDLMTHKSFTFNKDNLTSKMYGYGHLGSIDAYFNSTTYNPVDSVCFVFLFNGLSYPFSDVFFKTIDIFYNEPVTLPSFNPVVLEIDKLKEFEGKYKLRSGDIIEISVISGELYFVWMVNGYGKLKLTPIDRNMFVYDAKGLTFRFGYNNEKQVDKVTMYQGKQVIRIDKQ